MAPDAIRRLTRFSLRSLILLVALAGSGYGLRMKWEPWKMQCTLAGHDSPVRILSFSADGSRLASRSQEYNQDSMTRVWNVRSGRLITAQPRDVEYRGGRASWGKTAGLEFGNEGAWVVEPWRYGYKNGTLIWRVSDGKTIFDYSEIEIYQGRRLMDVCLTTRIAMTRIGPWTVQFSRIGSDASKITAPIKPGRAWRGRICPTGELACILDDDGHVHFLDTTNGAALETYSEKVDRFGLPEFSPDGRRFMMSYAHGTVLCETQTRREIKKFEYSKPSFSSNGRYLYAIWEHNEENPSAPKIVLRVWDAQSLQLLYRREWNSRLADDGPLFFSKDTRICVPREPPAPGLLLLSAHTGKQIAELADEKFMVSGEAASRFITRSPQSFRVRDSRSGALVAEFPGDPKSQIAITADGDTIAVSRGKTVELYARRRLEHWYGAVGLPEFWLSLTLAGALLCSIGRDMRSLKRAPLTD